MLMERKNDKFTCRKEKPKLKTCGNSRKSCEEKMVLEQLGYPNFQHPENNIHI